MFRCSRKRIPRCKTQSTPSSIIDAAQRHGKYIFFSTREAKLAAMLAAKGVQILHFHVGSDDWRASGRIVPLPEQLVADIKGAGAGGKIK